MMSIRLIAFDLDGTLLGSNGRISERTRAALRSAAMQGIHLAAASGRPLGALPLDLREIPEIRHVITSNGSSIFTFPEEERIFGRDMKAETVLDVLKVAEPSGFPWEIFIGGTGYGPEAYVRKASDFGVPERANRYVSRTRVPVADISAFTREHLQEIEGMNMIVADAAAKERLIGSLSEIPNLYITDSVSWYIELADGQVSKAAALATLAERLGVPMHQTAAFGDSMNDLDLLRGASLGIAMANARPELIAAADDHALSNDEDGVAIYIERHFI